MSLYTMFATDKEAEKDGVLIDLGGVRFLLARAGGANAEFARVFQNKAEPYQTAINQKTLGESVGNRILAEAYAEAVVLGWETEEPEDSGKWKNYIEDSDGKKMKFSVVNCVRLFTDLPELFSTIRDASANVSLYRQHHDEEIAKNSETISTGS